MRGFRISHDAAVSARRWGQAAAVACALLAGPLTAQDARPVTVEAVYTVDAYHNATGGLARGTDAVHNVDVAAEIDGNALLGLDGFDAFVYLLGNAGGSIGALAGDYQGASNIEAPRAIRLYEAWIRKTWNDGAASLLVGLYDLNGEFYVAETGLLFINSAHGIGPEFAASGRNGPSIFPATSLAARLRWRPSGSSYVMAGVLDGVPGDPERPRFVDLRLRPSEGALLVVETGLRREPGERARYGKLAAGGWAYTARFPDATSPDVSHPGAWGAYLILESELYREPASADQGLAAYGRIGVADDRVHPVGLSWGGGAVYAGPIPGRDADRAGVSIAVARHADRFLEARRDAGVALLRREVALEATYALPATEWLRFQPNVQYIVNPGMAPELDDALLVGLRVELGR